MLKDASIGVVHQRVTSHTAAMYSGGDIAGSVGYNRKWADYMNSEFQAPEYSKQQEKFNTKNARMNEAISNKITKNYQNMEIEQPMKVVKE